MAQVHIPALLRPVCEGNDSVQADGRTVAAVVDAIDRRFPGFRERIVASDQLRPDLAVAVDGEIAPLGLRAPVRPGSEVSFLTAVQGG